MLVHIKNLLAKEQLLHIKKLLATATFKDGKLSAGLIAQQVKNNEELDDEKIIAELNQLVMGNLIRHPEYKNAVLPHRIAVPFYARYLSGMHYGEHIDDPIMGQGMDIESRYRSDMAITIFLNSPEEYQGGELVIQTSYGEQTIKSPAGNAVLYPATTHHQVMPVTKGERFVAVTWAQSLIRDNEQRYLLYQLNKTREKLLRKDPNSDDTKRIDNTYVNLVRMWSEL